MFFLSELYYFPPSALWAGAFEQTVRAEVGSASHFPTAGALEQRETRTDIRHRLHWPPPPSTLIQDHTTVLNTKLKEYTSKTTNAIS